MSSSQVVAAWWVAGSTVGGFLAGQLTAGIPLSMRIRRLERRRRPRLPDWGEVLLDEWPDDVAAIQLAAWRDLAARRRREIAWWLYH